MTSTNKLDLARTSRLGLAVGDAFGETFFGPADDIALRINERILLNGTWPLQMIQRFTIL